MSPANMAKIILANHWDYVFPVEPVAIARKMGLEVYKDETVPASARYVEEMRAIYVKESESTERKRFSIAHEIGHAALGHGSNYRTGKVYNIANYEVKEFEANEFAAELLMPSDKVESLVYNTYSPVDDMAKFFGVSSQAMYIRLKRLGYTL